MSIGTGIFVVVSLFILWAGSTEKSKEAHEVERILAAQTEMPFQILIPGYLPSRFVRSKMQVSTGETGPDGEAVVKLEYATRKGNTITLREYLPKDADLAKDSVSLPRVIQYIAQCPISSLCQPGDVVTEVGPLRVMVRISSFGLVSVPEMQFILKTLGPATNRQVFSSIEDVPLSYTVPPAVEVSRNAEGIQEIVLVVTPDSYDPAHFSIKKGIPARLVFRQAGYVGCGNELEFQWGDQQKKTLTLTSASDKQILEFTPDTTGDFAFNCPHLIYQGVMSVAE